MKASLVNISLAKAEADLSSVGLKVLGQQPPHTAPYYKLLHKKA